MEKIFGGYNAQIYALVRIVVGLLFACHGAQSFLASSAGSTAPQLHWIDLAGVIEFFGGLPLSNDSLKSRVFYRTKNVPKAAFYEEGFA